MLSANQHQSRWRMYLPCVAVLLLTAPVIAASPLGPFEAAWINQVFRLRASETQQLAVQYLPDDALDLAVMIDGRPRRIRFEQHSVRAPGYQLLEQNSEGELVEIPSGPLTTYRGEDPNWPGMKAALSFEGEGFRVRVLDQDGKQWWIEPLVGRVRGAGVEDYVVYRGGDVISPPGTCGVDGEVILPGRPLGAAETRSGPNRALYSARFVVDTDFEFYQNYGSPTAVENRVNAVVNAVNLQYESQVEIVNEVQAVVVRSDSNDPYSTNSIDTRLNQVRTLWNSINNPPHDIVQLFSGESFSGSTIGLAYLGAVCSGFEYSVVESDCCGSFACATDLTAHELGHQWGSQHCNCPSNTMNPSITCTNLFSNSTIGQITGFRNSIANCLTLVEEDGACCTASGSCLITTPSGCGAAGGTFQGIGTTCADTVCIPIISGACCQTSGACAVVTVDDCGASGGVYQGDDISCSQANCQADPDGACCLVDGSCATTAQSVCLANGGTFEGADTSCSFLPCTSSGFVAPAHAIIGRNLLSLNQDNWTTEVFVVVEPGNRVDAVAGNAVNQKMLSATNGFFQSSVGAPTSAGINPAFFDLIPDVRFDTFVTIGARDSSGSPFSQNTLQDIGIDWTIFEGGGTLAVDNGTWFVLSTDVQGEPQTFTAADCSQQQGVLIAQLTAFDFDSTITFDALIQGRNSDGGNWQDSFSYSYSYLPTQDCNQNRIPDNCDIANGVSLDTNGNGIPDECDTSCPGDADGDGDADVDDILIVIGDFGRTGADLAGDLDGNGEVNVDDLLLGLGSFGGC